MNLSNQDKNLCVAVANKIIDDYICDFVLTDEYEKCNEDNIFTTSRQDMVCYLGMVLCQAITKIEQINNPQYPKLTLPNLDKYIQNIPQSSYHMISGYKSSNIRNSHILKDIFNELREGIHTLLPFYKGFQYEGPYIYCLFYG